MKKATTISLLVFISIFIFAACSGRQGPPGLDGLDGQDGAIFLAQTFEIDNVNFQSSNGTDAAIEIVIPDDVEVYETDIPLVFVLDPEASADNNADVWEPLPRTFFFENGFAQFRYNFIFSDPVFSIEVILESDDFTALDNSFISNQIFRVVIAPSEFVATTTVDVLDFNAVTNALQLEF